MTGSDNALYVSQSSRIKSVIKQDPSLVQLVCVMSISLTPESSEMRSNAS